MIGRPGLPPYNIVEAIVEAVGKPPRIDPEEWFLEEGDPMPFPGTWASSAAEMKADIEAEIADMRAGKKRRCWPWHFLQKRFWTRKYEWQPDMLVSVCLLIFIERIIRLEERIESGSPYR